MQNHSQKMWTLLVHLSMHYGYKRYSSLPFDEGMWDWILEKSKESGINTIVLDVSDGVIFHSHPEIAMPGAWTGERVKAELEKARKLGITLIPKLNFSAGHSLWLGKYSRMVSSEVYYRLCKDLITEIYALFEQPEYIHIGMDEEDEEHARYNPDGLGVFRFGELYWHDLRYLLDCVDSTGAKAWMWYDPTLISYERYLKTVDINKVVLSPWYYHTLQEEEFVPFDEYPWDKSPYAGLDLKYVEDIPKLKQFRENIIPRLADGHRYVPCTWASVNRNTVNLMEYFAKGERYDQVIGHMVSVWCSTQWENREVFENAFAEFFEGKAIVEQQMSHIR